MQHLPGLTLELRVNQYRSLDGVPVMSVMRRRLERPFKIAVIRVEGDDAASEEIITGSASSIQRTAVGFPVPQYRRLRSA